MGEILQINCTNCAYQTELFIGGGRQDCNLRTILSAIPPEKQEILQIAIRQGAVGLSVSRLPTACSACGTIYTASVVSYVLHDKKLELLGVCPKCGAQDKKASLSCPLCGAEVTKKKTGHWD